MSSMVGIEILVRKRILGSCGECGAIVICADKRSTSIVNTGIPSVQRLRPRTLLWGIGVYTGETSAAERYPLCGLLGSVKRPVPIFSGSSVIGALIRSV